MGPTNKMRIQYHKTVIVNGLQVTALSDFGSFMSLIKHSLVQVGNVDYIRQADILCLCRQASLY